jgi:hypothetical protein
MVDHHDNSNNNNAFIDHILKIDWHPCRRELLLRWRILQIQGPLVGNQHRGHLLGVSGVRHIHHSCTGYRLQSLFLHQASYQMASESSEMIEESRSRTNNVNTVVYIYTNCR